jgi:hypothetical protein
VNGRLYINDLPFWLSLIEFKKRYPVVYGTLSFTGCTCLCEEKSWWERQWTELVDSCTNQNANDLTPELPRNTLFNFANNDDWESLKQHGYNSFYYGEEKRYRTPRRHKQDDIGCCVDKYEGIAMGGTEEWKAKSSSIDWWRSVHGINLRRKNSLRSLPK